MRRRQLTTLSVALGLLFATSCFKMRDDGQDGGTADLGGELTDEEQDSVNRGAGAVPIFQQMVVLADQLFDFDPTLDPLKDALQNADAIFARIRQQLGIGDGGLGCGTVGLMGDTVTVSFGPAPGCKLVTGHTISGDVSASVSKANATLTVALVFTKLVINDVPLDGTASFATSTGNVFTVDSSLSSGNAMLTTTALSATGEPGAITVGGMASLTGNATKTNFTFKAVHWKIGDCYPDAGALTIKQGIITGTITFTADTPTTGEVMVRLLGKTTTKKLPAYGKCGR